MTKAYFIFVHSRDGKLNPYSVYNSNAEIQHFDDYDGYETYEEAENALKEYLDENKAFDHFVIIAKYRN